MFLKVGIMVIVLVMIEDDVFGSDLVLVNLVGAICDVSYDLLM